MLFERQQIGKREDLADYITRVDARQKPVMAMIPKDKKPTNSLVQFQVDDFEDPTDNAVPDGEDVSNFSNATQNRQLIKTYVQKFRESAMVSDFAENVSDVAGLSKGELAEAIMKKLEKVSRDIEAAICSDNEHQEGKGATPYKLRGLGMWIGGTQTLYPVDSTYATPAGSQDNTALASFTDDIVNNVMESSYQKTGKINTFQLVAGTKLKRAFTALSKFQTGSANVMSVLRVFNSQATDKKITNTIDTYEGDFGTIEIHPSLFMAHPNVGGSSAAQLRRGYLLIMDYLSLAYNRMPQVRQLEDRGGGPRFLIDAIVTLKVKNPLPLGKFYATS